MCIGMRTTVFGTTWTRFVKWQLILTDGGIVKQNFLALINVGCYFAGSYVPAAFGNVK